MPFDFLTPRVERLSADGALSVVHPGGAIGRVLRRPVLLLGRDLCAFGLFSTAALPRRRRRQAAMLHARLAAPYLRAGFVLSKAGDDYGVWWWDAARVEALSSRSEQHFPTLRSVTAAKGLASPRLAAKRVQNVCRKRP